MSRKPKINRLLEKTTNWKMTPDVIRKLEFGFAMDCTIGELCLLADISPDTFHRWMRENKELSDSLNRLRNKPVLKARSELIKGIEGNPELALKYLERKMHKEFGIKQKIEGEIKTLNLHALACEIIDEKKDKDGVVEIEESKDE